MDVVVNDSHHKLLFNRQASNMDTVKNWNYACPYCCTPSTYTSTNSLPYCG